MAPSDYRACEFFLIRVAPDPVRNEHLNIGVALFQPAGGFAGVRLNGDFRRAHCLFPQWEAADLAGLEQEIAAKLQPGSEAARDYLLHLSQETFSHALQFSPPQTVLTEDPALELERLYERYAATPAPPSRELQRGSRRMVLRELERVFTEERIYSRLQRNVRAGEWMGEPDSFRFDFHFKPNGSRHVIQAVPLEGDEAAVKEFCFTVARLRARLEAMAVGFDVASFTPALPSAAGSPAAYHHDLLLQAGVRVLALDAAPEEAGRIRAALRSR